MSSATGEPPNLAALLAGALEARGISYAIGGALARQRKTAHAKTTDRHVYERANTRP